MSSVMIVLFSLLMCWFVLAGFLFGLCQNGVSKKRIPLLAPKIIQPFYSKGLRLLCLPFCEKNNGVSKERMPLLTPQIIQPVVSVAFFVCFCLGLVKPPFHTDYRKQLSITAKTPWL